MPEVAGPLMVASAGKTLEEQATKALGPVWFALKSPLYVRTRTITHRSRKTGKEIVQTETVSVPSWLIGLPLIALEIEVIAAAWASAPQGGGGNGLPPGSPGTVPGMIYSSPLLYVINGLSTGKW